MNKEEVSIAHSILLDLLIEFHKFCKENDLRYYIIGGTLLGAVRHKGFIPWDVDADVAMPRDDYNIMLDIISEDFPDLYFIQNIDTEPHFHTPKTKILVRGVRKDNPDNYMISSRTGLNLDIFPLDNPPKNVTKRRIQRARLNLMKLFLKIKIRMVKKYGGFSNEVRNLIRNTLRIIILPLSEKTLIEKMTKIMTKYNKLDNNYLCSMSSHYDYNKQVMKADIYGEGKEIEFEGHMLIGPDKVTDYLVQIYGDYMELPSEENRRKMYEDLELELSDEIKNKYL